MKIIVCIKQVPNTSEVKINPETKTLIRDGVESIINPDDKNALEAALKIKDEKGAKVVVVSMGPMQAKEALLEARAMGADSAYLIIRWIRYLGYSNHFGGCYRKNRRL